MHNLQCLWIVRTTMIFDIWLKHILMLSMSADVEHFRKSCRFFQCEVRYRSTHGAAENGQRGHKPLLFQKPVFLLNHDSWTGGNYFFLSILESNCQIHQITLFSKMSMILDHRSPSISHWHAAVFVYPDSTLRSKVCLGAWSVFAAMENAQKLTNKARTRTQLQSIQFAGAVFWWKLLIEMLNNKNLNQQPTT